MRVAWLLATLVVLPCASADRPTRKLIAAGEACYQELNYGCAIAKLGQARERAAAGMAMEREDALTLCRTLAFALASVERHEEAAAEFGRCFEVDPTFRLDPSVISPKIYADYRAARSTQLGALIRGDLRLPPSPEVYPPPPLTADDLVLHVPTGLATGAALREDEALRHQVGFMAGVRLLFGDDAENFEPGFGIGVDYLFDLTDLLQLNVALQFSQHISARDDTKIGFPSSLFIFDPGVGLRLTFPVGEWIDLSFGVLGGVSMSGLGGIGEQTSGMVAGRFSVTVKPMREFGVGVSVIPTLVVGTLSNGDLGTSLTLPIVARFEAHF